MLRSSIVLGLLLAALTPRAEAQVLEDTWFKLKVVAKGLAFATEDGSTPKTTLKTTVYLHVQDADIGDGDPGGPTTVYDFELWAEHASSAL